MTENYTYCRACAGKVRLSLVHDLAKDTLAIKKFNFSISLREAFFEITRIFISDLEANKICGYCLKRLRLAFHLRLEAQNAAQILRSLPIETHVKIEEEEKPPLPVTEVKIEEVRPEVVPAKRRGRKAKVLQTEEPLGEKTNDRLSKTEEFLFICDLCAEKFEYRRQISKHMRQIHMSFRPFKCWVAGCEKTFMRAINCRLHQVIHTKDKHWICEVCGRAFSDSFKLRNHVRIHTNDRPYKCPFDGCPAAFKQHSELRTHKMSLHSNERPFSCEFCGSTFKIKNSLRTHRRAMHTKQGMHSCLECSKSYPNPSMLREHIAVAHRGERPYPCKQPACSKAYTKSSHLNRHIRDAHPEAYAAIRAATIRFKGGLQATKEAVPMITTPAAAAAAVEMQ